MIPDADRLESASDDLALARTQLEAAREVLRQAPGDVPEIRAAITRLKRLAAEVATVERVVEGVAAVEGALARSS